MNKLDSEIAEASLSRHGFEAVSTPEQADAVLFNTCAVRGHAEERLLSRIGALLPLKRARPELVLGVLGCVAEEHGSALLANYPHLSLVAGTRHFSLLGPLLGRALAGERVLALEGGEDPAAEARDLEAVRVGPRAFVAVQRGCSLGCAYCIVPSVRGPWRSREEADILAECSGLLAAGAVDLTLLGQTVDAWGRDFSPPRPFAGLLERVHELPGLRRLHFVTSHPACLGRDVARLFADLPRLARWVHLPAQSGSTRVLAAMRRGYTRERYLEVVAALREADPRVAVASDFIVGFPGETEQDHQESLSLLEEARFSQCYVFKFSPRPGTPAASLPGVPREVIRRRHAELLGLHETLSAETNAALVGSVQEVLVEGPSRRDPGRVTGRSPQHRLVHFPAAGAALVGQVVPIKILSASSLCLVGERIEE